MNRMRRAAQAVIAEALPHLCEEKRRKPAWVTEEAVVVIARPLAMAAAGGVLGEGRTHGAVVVTSMIARRA